MSQDAASEGLRLVRAELEQHKFTVKYVEPVRRPDGSLVPNLVRICTRDGRTASMSWRAAIDSIVLAAQDGNTLEQVLHPAA